MTDLTTRPRTSTYTGKLIGPRLTPLPGDCNGFEAAMSLGYRFCQGTSFGTYCQAI